MNQNILKVKNLFIITSLIGLTSCGGGSNDKTELLKGVFEDSKVIGLNYETLTTKGITNQQGEFEYKDGETITFKLGEIYLGAVKAKDKISTFDIGDSLARDVNTGQYKDLKIATLLQSLDNNQNPSDGYIDLTDMVEKTTGFPFDIEKDISQETLDTITGEANKAKLVSNTDAFNHASTALYQAIKNENGKVILTSQIYQADFDAGHRKTGVRVGIRKKAVTNLASVTVESGLTILSHSDKTINPDNLESKRGTARNRIHLITENKEYHFAMGIGYRIKNGNYKYYINNYLSKTDDKITWYDLPESTKLPAYNNLNIEVGTEYSAKLEYDATNNIINGYVNGNKILYWNLTAEETITSVKAFVENRADYRGDLSSAMPGDYFISAVKNLSININGVAQTINSSGRISF